MRVIVLGGGPGGYAAAFEAARLGAEVSLVERDRLGGTCLNRGCIPTKTILRSAQIVKDTSRASEFGLNVEVASVDIDALRARKESVVDELVAQLDGTARRLGVQVVEGEGRLLGSREVEVTRADGERTVLRGDAVILSTGSVPAILPGIDHALEGVWTSDQAVALSEIPKDVVIIGGGVIGLEFACAYAAFGSCVRVVELMEQVLPGQDRRVARVTQEALEAMGVSFSLGDAVDEVHRADGRMYARLRSGGMFECDVVLSAVGRQPDSAGFGFEEAGVELERGAVRVDERFRTSAPGVYAVGDVIGGFMLAHVAEAEGEAAARNAVAELRGEEPAEFVRYDCIPACVYTFPEVATVGWSRDSARERGVDVVQALAKFAANGKAMGEGESEGFVQLVAEKGTGRIVGCQIVGPHAVETCHEVAVAMRNQIGVGGLAHTVHAHPTVSEVIRFAALDAAGKCGV